MKTSYNWLTKHISISKSINELTDKLTLLGLECSYKKIDKLLTSLAILFFSVNKNSFKNFIRNIMIKLNNI